MSANIGLIYDSQIRNNGTPVHFWHAFKQLGIPFRRYLPHGGLPKHDFYVWIDDGRDDLLWLPPEPWGFYATDTHLGWDYRFRKAQHADIVWCAQKPAAERMKDAGLNAHWLPLACNPIAHPTAEELQQRLGIPVPEKKYDVAFVGHLQPSSQSNRVEFLDELFKAFPNFRVGFGVFHEDAAKIYHQAKIGINHAVRDDLNMRFFELASMGVIQLCDNRMQGMNELGFKLGSEYFSYESAEEAIGLIDKVLRHGLFRHIRIQEAALKRVRSEHTYAHRVHKMHSDICELLQ